MSAVEVSSANQEKGADGGGGGSNGGSCAEVSGGTVYLVGAGPGAVGLLTLRAAEVLCACDVVLHDRLVPMEVVRLAKASAEVRYVGKEGNVNSEAMKVQQDDISGQLVQLARKGLSVCRLKGGDPMIYGRVGEEMEELAAAGVPFEIVPGVTAALAAGADARVPLTFRKVATSLRILTMNPSTLRDASFDWAQFAAPATTFVLYMGLSSLGSVCEGLLQRGGVSAETPMAVVDRASMPSTQTVVGTVGTLPEAVRGRADLEGPALVLLGEVVALRHRLQGVPSPPRRASLGAEDAAYVAATAALPACGEEGLRRLRARIDELLASSTRTTGEAGDHATVVAMPPAKRPASS